MLNIGNNAISFELKNKNSEMVNLKSYLGKWVVIYFYPKDDTPGCTKEACDFSDLIDEFSDLNTTVIGISPDTSESHLQFIRKYNLKIELLSDKSKDVMKAYAAWGKKNMYGKISEGVIRSTFIIDPEGIIAAKWSKVNVRVKSKSGESKHADAVRKKLQKLQESI